MKSRVLSVCLLLTLLLPVLAGCGVPGATDKLILYSPDNGYSSLLNPALEIFKELYPEVEVSYQIIDEDEYRTKIREEIPAGEGPDLVLFRSNTFWDIYKTASSKVFVDLDKYFKKDEEIDLADFVGPVMDGGVVNGKRVFAPLNYEMPLILTTQSILDEIGMTVDALENCDGFCEGAIRFHEKYPDATLFFDTCGGYNPCVADIRTLYKNFGFDFIGYPGGQIRIDEARLRQCMDLVKLYYDPDYDVTDMSLMDEVDDYDFGCGLSRKLLLYDDFCAANYVRYSRGSQLLRDQGEEPLMFVQKNQRGGITAELDYCAAIPKNSKNKANAWRLLKILLSDEIQGGHDKEVYNNSYFYSGFPARLSATKAAIDKGFTMSPKGPVFDEYVALVQSPTEATLVPQAYRQIMDEEIMPYIRGEKTWDDCYQNFLNALKLYKDE